MNNDLISREALKEDLKRYFTNGAALYQILTIIDNAPTVCGNNPKWCENCVSKGNCASTRPKGEWIGKEEYDDYPNKTVCECSECGKMICISHNDFPNFCENCGADMRGSKNDNKV